MDVLKNVSRPGGEKLICRRGHPAKQSNAPQECDATVELTRHRIGSCWRSGPLHRLRRLGTPLLLAAISGLMACLSDWQPPSAGEPPSAGAKVLFVAPKGSDSNPGTRDAPFQTISAAAALARAGDVVRVNAGTYPEAISVAGDGSREQPIVFEAEVPGSVTITGEGGGFAPLHWAGDHDSYAQSGNRWVTLRGFVFSGISDRPAVRAATGWRIEDCLFEQLFLGINVRGNSVTITRSIFQDIDSVDAHAIVAYGARDLHLTDLLIQRINRQRLIEAVANSAVVKLLDTQGLLVERVVSRNNVGPGLWLDYNNKNFVIRRNFLSGNRGDQHDWEGPGMWIELNHSAAGQIYENTITNNSGAGIEIMESNDVDVYDNILLGNDVCIALRNLDRGPEYELRNIRIHGNLCADWRSAGVATSIGDWDDWDAASRRVVIDGGVYLAPPETPIFAWLGETVMTLQEAAVEIGLEANGVAHRTDGPSSGARLPAAESGSGLHSDRTVPRRSSPRDSSNRD